VLVVPAPEGDSEAGGGLALPLPTLLVHELCKKPSDPESMHGASRSLIAELQLVQQTLEALI